MDNPIIISAVGGVILLIFTIWASYIQKKQSDQDKEDLIRETKKVGELQKELRVLTQEYAKAQEEKSDIIIHQSDELKVKAEEQATIIAKNALDQQEAAKRQQESAQKLIETQAELIGRTQELTTIQKQLIRTQQELFDYQTGGDSWCYVRLALQQDHTLSVFLFHQGKYPLTDLRIKITRTSAIKREVKDNLIAIKGLVYNGKYTTTFLVTSLAKPRDSSEGNIVIGSVPLDYGLDEMYSIEYSTAHKKWTETYSLDFNNEGKFYKGAFKVMRDGNVLMENTI